MCLIRRRRRRSCRRRRRDEPVADCPVGPLDVLAADLYPLVRELSFLVMKDTAPALAGGFLAWAQTAKA